MTPLSLLTDGTLTTSETRLELFGLKLNSGYRASVSFSNLGRLILWELLQGLKREAVLLRHA